MISKLIPVELREIWNMEPNDFTKWLGNHLDFLNYQLGIELNLVEIGKSAGSFYVDILAKDNSGRLVIIENQLEKTDHKHLGQILTYLTNLEAKTAIWISPDPRPEHISVINYLNQISPEDIRFYLVKISAYKIDSSSPAPLFNVVAGPEDELRAIGKIKNELSEKDKKRLEFFSQLLRYSNTKTSLFGGISAVSYQDWIMTGAGKTGLFWVYYVGANKSYVHLFFCLRDAKKNKERFKKIFKYKSAIEKDFGGKLEWDFKEGRQQQYIRSSSRFGGIKDETKWDDIQRDIVTRMIKLEKAIKKYLRMIN